MTELTLQQQRVLKVLDRIGAEVRNDDDSAYCWSEELEVLLNELGQNDFFGTERQCDPRGDQRDEAWTMKRVQGVDK
jgi:hypothetical protein